MSSVNGISVSVSSSPRTPRTPPVSAPRTPPVSAPRTPPVSASSGNHVSAPGAPMKKRYEESVAIVVIDVSSDEEEEESVSPRVLFPVGGGGPSRDVARRLDFYSSGEWSPIPFATASVASSVATSVARKPEEEKPVGDCSVCYASLPARSNHVYTLCGHLFCVKCLLRWWDTAITCPICRANILEADAVDAVDAVDVSSSESDSDNDFVGDDNVGGIGGVDELPPPSITSFNRYLHLDSLVVWSAAAAGGVTDPEHDDDNNAVQLSQDERDDIRWNREIATTLWARSRFRDTLFSNIEFLGRVFHEFIPKIYWIELGHDDMGPHRMFEFVMCDTTSYNRPIETNYFGYISSIVVVRVERATARLIDDDDEWENTHEYAFIVHVFSPTAPYGRYNVEESTFETAELLFRFADIRRMYSITAMEVGGM